MDRQWRWQQTAATTEGTCGDLLLTMRYDANMTSLKKIFDLLTWWKIFISMGGSEIKRDGNENGKNSQILILFGARDRNRWKNASFTIVNMNLAPLFWWHSSHFQFMFSELLNGFYFNFDFHYSPHAASSFAWPWNYYFLLALSQIFAVAILAFPFLCHLPLPHYLVVIFHAIYLKKTREIHCRRLKPKNYYQRG